MRPRLPLTVISGYLGAGKTTLINRLLVEDHGLRLMIMVNDFGAINIDAALLEAASDDTLTLSSGCVCCTMGADLFMAIGDVLDRPVRPDHLVIEASGIADPARIAQVAFAEPELIHGGIVTVVDGLTYEALAADRRIGVQVAGQVAAADLVCVSKLGRPNAALALRLGVQARAPVIDLAGTKALSPVLFGVQPVAVARAQTAGHAPYVAWHHRSALCLSRDALMRRLAAKPEGLFRLKGFVGESAARAWQVHCVGHSVSVKPMQGAQETRLVGIGLRERIAVADIEAWWRS